MRRQTFLFALGVFLAGALTLGMLGAGAPQGSSKPAPAAKPVAASPPAGKTPWSLDADYIEACSCHLFCPCYFNTMAEHPFCEFQMAVRVNNGTVGNVPIKGALFWLTGDLGEHWGDQHKSPWLVITFDPSVKKEQREELLKVVPKLYPTQFAKVEVDESKITWSVQGTEARAKLANGKGEMVLERFAGADGGAAVLQNVKYWSAAKNHGFVMYKSKLHRWDGFGHKFSYTGRNAFTIRIESSGTL